MTRAVTPTKKQKKAAKLYVRGIDPKNPPQDGTPAMPLATAMRHAGYDESTSRRGVGNLKSNPGLALAIQDEQKKLGDSILEKAGALMHVSKNLQDGDLRHLIRGRIAAGVTDGDDRGIQAAKLGASLKELQMTTPDMLVGVSVVNNPIIDKILADTERHDAERKERFPHLYGGTDERQSWPYVQTLEDGSEMLIAVTEGEKIPPNARPMLPPES